MNYVFLYLCPLGTSLSFSFSFSPSLSRFISSQSLAMWLALANEILANIMPQSPKSACLLVTLPPPWKSPNSSLEDVKTCRVRSLIFHPSHPQTSPPKVKCKCEPSPCGAEMHCPMLSPAQFASLWNYEQINGCCFEPLSLELYWYTINYNCHSPQTLEGPQTLAYIASDQ